MLQHIATKKGTKPEMYSNMLLARLVYAQIQLVTTPYKLMRLRCTDGIHVSMVDLSVCFNFQTRFPAKSEQQMSGLSKSNSGRIFSKEHLS